ncbi:DarT ssDNA thymidine ADP-ribosyltransferase family protein [Bacillus cereus]|nr:DarT ssDNA thymidine ADP-ribosyltransferase family protein [Bacillus cereus]
MHSNTFIYHMTHYRNLSKILSSNGLVCVSNIMNNGQTYRNIANNDIQSRRASYSVPVEPFGTLHKYVPFYFVPKSPMLYSIYKGNVIQYNEGQEPLIILYRQRKK